jgi:hypothetical protein
LGEKLPIIGCVNFVGLLTHCLMSMLPKPLLYIYDRTPLLWFSSSWLPNVRGSLQLPRPE